MGRVSNATLWTEEGYALFASEGLAGVQVERLARILQLNKSGFYHYFGDFEGYCTELIALHRRKLGLFLQEVRAAKQFDPDYLILLVKHIQMVMFQVQLTRTTGHSSFTVAGSIADRAVNFAVHRLWNEYLGGGFNAELAMRYYNFVRDTVYTRATVKNINYQLLHDLVANARALVTQVGRYRILCETQSLRDAVDDAV